MLLFPPQSHFKASCKVRSPAQTTTGTAGAGPSRKAVGGGGGVAVLGGTSRDGEPGCPQSALAQPRREEAVMQLPPLEPTARTRPLLLQTRVDLSCQAGADETLKQC